MGTLPSNYHFIFAGIDVTLFSVMSFSLTTCRGGSARLKAPGLSQASRRRVWIHSPSWQEWSLQTFSILMFQVRSFTPELQIQIQIDICRRIWAYENSCSQKMCWENIEIGLRAGPRQLSIPSLLRNLGTLTPNTVEILSKSSQPNIFSSWNLRGIWQPSLE